VHVLHGWVWKWGQQAGGNANSPCLGGSSGGDDRLLPLILFKVEKITFLLIWGLIQGFAAL